MAYTRYTKPVDIWAEDRDLWLDQLQPGQWVFAGTDEGPGSPTRGRFLGVRPSGAIIVAWTGNARRSGNYRAYLKSLHTYARG